MNKKCEIEGQQVLVAVVPKNHCEELRFVLSEFQGYPLVGLRVFCRGADGSMKPGRTGIAFRQLLPDLIEAFGAAFELARKGGQF